MFIPAAGGGIRSKMTAGDVGHDYDAGNSHRRVLCSYPVIHSPDKKSFWSLGISMPEAEITRISDPIRKKMVFFLAILRGHRRRHGHPGHRRGQPDVQRDHRAHPGPSARA